MKVSSIARAIVSDMSWFEGPFASYSSWVEVLIGGWHLWVTIVDLLHKFTMHEHFYCQKRAIPYALIRRIPEATIEIGHCRTLIYIPIMNRVARLSLIFSLTTTTNHFPFPHICNKTSSFPCWDSHTFTGCAASATSCFALLADKLMLICTESIRVLNIQHDYSLKYSSSHMRSISDTKTA